MTTNTTMAETTTKTYIVGDVKNTTLYVEEFVYPTALTTTNKAKAQNFPTYSKANTFTKKMNKFYGYKRYKVITLG